MNDFVPTRKDRLSFGLWTVGWQGVDVFGGVVRPPMDPAEAVHRLSDLGAYGVTFHDNDVFPFGASEKEREQHFKPFRKALEETGLQVPDGNHQPVLALGVPGRWVTTNDATSAVSRSVKPRTTSIDLAAELGAQTFVRVGWSRGR